MLELRFSRRFSMGHRLISGAAESCALPHGHNEIVTAHLSGRRGDRLDPDTNMLVPFDRAKARWHRFVDERLDHALQLSERDPLLHWFRTREPERAARIVVTPGDPTTELMACLLMSKLGAMLEADAVPLRCHAIELEETPTNAVRFSGDPLALIPAAAGWWRRADDSIS